MKQCYKCGQAKELTMFNNNKRTKDGKQNRCRDCHNADQRVYTKANWQKSLTRQRIRRLSKRQYVWDYYLAHPCVDCGEANPRKLTFDHLGDKKYAIGTMAGSNLSISILKAEIAKCVVRCYNCHMLKTSFDHRWYKGITEVGSTDLSEDASKTNPQSEAQHTGA